MPGFAKLRASQAFPEVSIDAFHPPHSNRDTPFMDRVTRQREIPPPHTARVEMLPAAHGLAPSLDADLAILSSYERDRAGRFRFEHLRADYIRIHGWLRRLLGELLAVSPAEVAYTVGPRGKPHLDPRINPRDLRFNLAHAGALAIAAVTRGAEVGVDIEPIDRSMADRDEIAGRSFAHAERPAILGAATPEEAAAAFFRTWTRKEAYMKARGEGLHIPLDSYQVPQDPGPGLVGVVRDEKGGAWEVHDLETRPGIAAAVVLEGEGWTVVGG